MSCAFVPLVFDAATEPAATVQPDPSRAMPARIGRVLGLVHTLITYSKSLATTLWHHADNPNALPCFAFVARTFRTGDLVPILTRIGRDLLRAEALAARLQRRAAQGRDLTPTPFRLPSPRKPRLAKPATPPAEPASPLTLEQLLARDRRRPIGAVLVDICLDLGIVPGQMDRATWEELHHEIIEYGGSLVTLLFQRQNQRRSLDPASPLTPGESPRVSPTPATGPTIVFPPWPTRSPRSPAPLCTGPP